MIKFSEEEFLDKSEAASPAEDKPEPEEESGSAPKTEDEIREYERLRKHTLVLVGAGIKQAEGMGFLGALKVNVTDGISSAVTSLLSGGLPSVNPLAARIKSKKNIGVEYNSEYNQKARDEFNAIMTDLRRIISRNLRPFLNLIKKEDEAIEPQGDQNLLLDNFYDIINRLITSKNKTSQLMASSPSGIILNEVIPEIIKLFKGISAAYTAAINNGNEESLHVLYSTIKSLESFSDIYEPSRLETAIQKSKSEERRGKGSAKKSPKAGPATEETPAASGPKKMLIKLVIPIKGFDDETMDGDEHTVLQAQDPLIEDLVFGIEFAKDISEMSADDVWSNMMKTEGLTLNPYLPKANIEIRLWERDRVNILKVTIPRRDVLRIRESGYKSLFSMDYSGSADGMKQVVMAKTPEQEGELKKLSSAASTTPLYEGHSPSGERISFTPSDLVAGGGYLTDSKGKKFKPKKIKGKSLASRVMSKEFGKTKK